jgi:hypothetical protein
MLSFILSFDLRGQSCIPSHYLIDRQGQIDSFSILFPGCTDILGELTIASSKIKNLQGLNQIKTISILRIRDTDITSLAGLESLDSIYYDLVSDENLQLEDVSALMGIRYIGRDLYIEYSAIKSLSGLDSLNYIGSSFQLVSNSNLAALNGLESLTHVGFSLNIEHFCQIQNLEGLNALQECGFLQLVDLPFLNSLDGLESLDSIFNNLEISYNPLLTDVNSLHDLQYIGENFWLNQNGSLTSLPVFESLNSIDGEVSITNNVNLLSVGAFQNLYYLNGGLTISGNSKLASLVGLDNINWWSMNGLVLKDNPSLMTCVTPAICQYLARNQPSYISNNASGCQSAEEIVDLCGPLSTNGSIESKVVLYPNPTTSSIHFTGEQVINRIIIHDASGIPLIKIDHPNEEIDLSQYPSGIYFIQVQMDAGVVMKRISKI